MNVVDLTERRFTIPGSALSATPEQVLEHALKCHREKPGDNVALIILADKAAAGFNFQLYMAGMSHPEAIGWIEGVKRALLREWDMPDE